MRELTTSDVRSLDKVPIVIYHKKLGRWVDIAESVEYIRGWHNVKLWESAMHLPVDQYGTLWVAFTVK